MFAALGGVAGCVLPPLHFYRCDMKEELTEEEKDELEMEAIFMLSMQNTEEWEQKDE